MIGKARNWCGRLAAVVTFAVMAPAAFGQTTWHVDGSNACPGSGSESDPFCAIQPAINAAAGGDEIIVAPGTYNEAINMSGKLVHLRSSGGPAATIIDASGLGMSVILCVSGEEAETVIEGFTITGGSATQGGGLRIFNARPTLVNCDFVANTATNGGAIYSDTGGNITIDNCRFIDNVASNNGGGIVAINFSLPAVTGSIFKGNTAGSGGAIWNSPGTFCATHLADSTFCQNGPNHIFGQWHDEGGNAFDPPGDINCDGVVDVSDLLMLLAAWGECPPGDDCPADLNDDGVVDVSDLLILLANWG